MPKSLRHVTGNSTPRCSLHQPITAGIWSGIMALAVKIRTSLPSSIHRFTRSNIAGTGSPILSGPIHTPYTARVPSRSTPIHPLMSVSYRRIVDLVLAKARALCRLHRCLEDHTGLGDARQGVQAVIVAAHREGQILLFDELRDQVHRLPIVQGASLGRREPEPRRFE